MYGLKAHARGRRSCGWTQLCMTWQAVFLLTRGCLAAINNCKAGGPGYAMALDGDQGTTISYHWKHAPTTKVASSSE